MPIELRKFQFANLARTTLSQAVSASDLQLTLQNAVRFPDTDPPGVFDIECEEIVPLLLFNDNEFEVVYGVVKAGEVFTVERGKEGTAAKAFPTGAAVINQVTAAFLQQQAAGLQPPSTPILTGEVNMDGVTFNLSWTAVTVDSGDELLAYDVYRDDSDGNGFQYVGSSPAGTLSFNDDTVDLSAGVTYSWIVAGRTCVAGQGAFSDAVLSLQDFLLNPTADGYSIGTSRDYRTVMLYARECAHLGDSTTVDWGAGDYSPEQNTIVLGSFTSNNGPFYLSTDYGRTFRQYPIGGLNPGTGVIPRAFERGIKWVPQYNNGNGYWIAFANFASSPNNAWYSADGREWLNAPITGDDVNIWCRGLDIVPSTGRVFAACQTNPFGDTAIAYTDDGESWISDELNLGLVALGCVLVQPDETIVMISTAGSSIIYSTDNGASWNLNSAPGVAFLGVPSRLFWDYDNDRLVMYTNQGNIYAGTAAGADWAEIHDHVFSGGDMVYDPTTGKLLLSELDNFDVSDDFGVTWSQVGDGWHDADTRITMMAKTPGLNTTNLLMCLMQKTLGQAPSRVMRSDDGGMTWWAISLDQYESDAATWTGLCYNEAMDRWFICNSDGTNRIYYSDDNGETWTAATYAGVAAFNKIKALSNGVVVAFVHAQVATPIAYSVDGETFLDASLPLGNFEVQDVEYIEAWGGYRACGTGGGNAALLYLNSEDLSDDWGEANWPVSARAYALQWNYETEELFVFGGVNSGYKVAQDNTFDPTNYYNGTNHGSSRVLTGYVEDVGYYHLTETTLCVAPTMEGDWVAQAAGHGRGTPSHEAVIGSNAFCFGGSTGGFCRFEGPRLWGPETDLLSNIDMPAPTAMAMKGAYNPAGRAAPYTWDFRLSAPSRFWQYWGDFAATIIASNNNPLYGMGQATFTVNTVHMDGFWPYDEERVVGLDFADLGFKVGFRAMGSACGGGTTAQTHYFACINSDGTNGNVWPVGIAIEFACLGGAATDIDTIDIGYFDGTSKTFNNFTNGGGPTTLAGDDQNVCQLHEASFSIVGTTLTLYMNGVEVESFTLTAGEITALTGINKPAWLTPLNRTQDMMDLYLFELGDSSVAV